MIPRRRLIVAFAAAALPAPRIVAQSAPRSAVVGYLRLGKNPLAPQFVDAMRELDWVAGRNLRIEFREAANDAELRTLASELVGMRVDVLICDSTPATRAGLAATTTIPIVFTIGADPIKNGLVASMARPGGNATGYTFGLYEEKMVETLTAALPQVTRIGFAGGDFSRVESAAKELGVQIVRLDVPAAGSVASLFDGARKKGAQAVVVPNVPQLNPVMEHAGGAALRARMPAISWDVRFARSGGLLAFGPVTGEGWPRIASQVDRILRGAKPADIPVEQPSKFNLVINLATAKTLGIAIPPPLLLRADEVVK